MSTTLKSSLNHGIILTRYYGGDKRGQCIQLTGYNCDNDIGYIGITREECLWLAYDLINIYMGREEEYNDNEDSN